LKEGSQRPFEDALKDWRHSSSEQLLADPFLIPLQLGSQGGDEAARHSR